MEENNVKQCIPSDIQEMLMQLRNNFEDTFIETGNGSDLKTNAESDFPEVLSRLNVNPENVKGDLAPVMLQIKSDSYNNFINIRPRFFEKWGIVIIASLIALGLLACCFIKYPEIVKGNIKVQSENSPKALIPNINGKIIRILKKNNDKLIKGENIIYIESTANHDEVLSAYKKIEQFVSGVDSISELDFSLPDDHISQYGELQAQIQNFQQSYLNYKDNLSSGIFEKKRSMIQSDIQILEKQIENVDNQKKGTENELKYLEEKAKTNEILYKSGAIARDEYNTGQANYIAKKNTIMQFVAVKLSYETQINQKRREIMELEQQAKNQRSLFIESVNTLKSQFDEWINKYIIKAPISGTLVFSSFIQENQLLKAGEKFGMVTPGNNENYVEMYISENVFPKVKLNQKVILKFPAYPIQDYGYIMGNINYISPLLNDSCFLVKVSCNNISKGNNNNIIRIKHGMSGVGEIIVKDRTIMGRLIFKLTEKF